VSILNLALLTLTAAGVTLGVWGICWARASDSARQAAQGRRLFVVALLFLGGCGLVAASSRADALVPLGLSAGLLVVGMVWEAPMPNRTAAAAPERERL
jgi:hypothetical protein